MNTFPLLKSFPHASRLVFGCMGLGGGWNREPISSDDRKKAQAAVESALASGITMFDHADIYTLGKAEQVFGELIKAQPALRDRIILQSKCGIRFADEQGPNRYDLSPEWIEQSVSQTLKRLQTDYLDILLLHRPDPLMEPAAIADILQKLHSAGKVRHFGVSNMNQYQHARLQAAMQQPLIVNQIPLSLKQHDFVEDGVLVGMPDSAEVGYTPGLTEYSEQRGVQVQAWGCLAQGLYSGRDISDQSETVKATAALVGQLAEQHSTSAEAIVLAWLMRHPMAIQPVIGTTDPERVRACAQAMDIELSREDWYRLYVSARGHDLP